MAVPFGKKVITIVKLFTEPQILSSLLSLRSYGYLSEVGWFNALKTKSSVDQNSKPIPWVTYPFLDFINERLNRNLEVFEFGSGNSTLFFSRQVGQITSAEHNTKWYDYLIRKIPENVKLILTNSDNEEDYIGSLSNGNKKFDIIFIDGIHRVTCCNISINFLNSQGVIILDDSERDEYKSGIEYIIKNGFKRIDFWGISPGYLFKKSTTIFYKDNNCLDI
jgi:Methyltransferase domain